MSEEATINIKGPSELKLSISISLDKTVKDLKNVIAEKSNVEADRQRLIYSGRVLKDDDLLSTYKIQSNHTIHMVKGVTPSAQQASTSQQTQRLPNMAAGQNPSDPLTMLTTPMAHGALAGFNPFADMGVNPNDPNLLQNMMDSPQFADQMSAMMSNPQIVEQMIQLDPRLRDNPEMRALFQSPQFRAMVSNPEVLRSMMTIGQHLRPAAGGEAGAFPPLAGLAGFGGLGGPFRIPPQAGAGGAAASTASPTGAPAPGSPAVPTPGGHANPNANPYGMIDPAMLMSIMGGMGSTPAFGNPSAQTPTQAGPPPEERYASQLQQLADMGFTNSSQNVRALLASGGNVQSAIEYILEGRGL